MTRAFNFSAGPATLPESVLRQAQAEMLDWNGVGASIVEISHRGAGVHRRGRRGRGRPARAAVGIPDDYAVLFLAGGATTQQALLALNFAAPGQTVDYVVTGHWGKTAIKQVAPYVNVNIAADGEAGGFRDIPARDTLAALAGAAYVHITANETIHGVEFRDTPDVGDAPLFADFSSSIASEPIDVVEVRRDLCRCAEEPGPGRRGRGDHPPRPARTQRPAARRHLRLPLARRARFHAQHAADLELVPGRAGVQVDAGAGRRARNSHAAARSSRSWCTTPSMLPAVFTATK